MKIKSNYNLRFQNIFSLCLSNSSFSWWKWIKTKFKKSGKLNSTPFLAFRRDQMRSTWGIISGLGIICGAVPHCSFEVENFYFRETILMSNDLRFKESWVDIMMKSFCEIFLQYYSNLWSWGLLFGFHRRLCLNSFLSYTENIIVAKNFENIAPESCCFWCWCWFIGSTILYLSSGQVDARK